MKVRIQMRYVRWLGWVFAGLLLLNASVGAAVAAREDPLEGRVLEHSNGTLYLYHAGLNFTVVPADVADPLIDAIPTASFEQWQSAFGSTPAPRPSVPNNPEPFPGYS
jgi:hypothetical protein